jgi:cell division protease FtsH
VFDEVTTGAESDMRQATQLARGMVTRWWMSHEIGFVSLLSQDGQAWAAPGVEQPSEHPRQLVDDEIRTIIEDAHADVTRLLAQNRERHDSLAEALMQNETLDEAEAYAAAGVTAPPAPPAEAEAVTRSELVE